MKGIAAVWIGGATTVLAASSMAVVKQNNRKNDSFQEDVALSYRKHWNNRRVNRDVTRYPLFPITKGACFASFFPRVDLPHRPSQAAPANQEVKDAVPQNFSLKPGPEQPVGCKLMKMSLTEHNVAFGYMSETTVRSGSYGMAVYGASTNLKYKSTTDSEYWVFFLQKNGDRWSIIKSFFRTLAYTQGSNGNKTPEPFNVHFPTKKGLWNWSHNANKTTELENLMKLQTTDNSETWNKSPDKLFSRLWFGGQEDGDVVDELFYDGSNERFFFKKHFKDQVTKPPSNTLPFLQTISLDNKGSWKELKEHCTSLYALGRESRPDWEQNLCFSQPKEK